MPPTVAGGPPTTIGGRNGGQIVCGPPTTRVGKWWAKMVGNWWVRGGQKVPPIVAGGPPTTSGGKPAPLCPLLADHFRGWEHGGQMVG